MAEVRQSGMNTTEEVSIASKHALSKICGWFQCKRRRSVLGDVDSLVLAWRLYNAQPRLNGPVVQRKSWTPRLLCQDIG